MRRRSILLLLIACFLGTPVLIHAYRAGQHCAAITGQTDASPFSVSDPSGACRTFEPDPLWARAFGVLALASLVASGIGLAREISARRQEQNLLARMGVRVDESELPLEE